MGDRIKRLQLAKTLELIAEKGSEVLYTGSLAAGFVKDIGGIIDEQDLKDYKYRIEILYIRCYTIFFLLDLFGRNPFKPLYLTEKCYTHPQFLVPESC